MFAELHRDQEPRAGADDRGALHVIDGGQLGCEPGEVIRRLTPVEAAMFEDMGWNVSPLAIIPEPSTLMLLAMGFTCLAALRRLAVKSTSQLSQFNSMQGNMMPPQGWAAEPHR